MLKPMKKLLTALLALLMTMALLPASAEENATMLQLTFIGMYANSDGTYTARNLTGQFEVIQNGEKLGVISSDETGSQSFVLSQPGNVQLIPVMSTIPEEIPVNEAGYSVSIVQGQFNIAPIVLYAEAGLFAVHTESAATFVLISERGDEVLRFSTDSRGDYALPTAIAAGQYTLRMEEASLAIAKWRDKIINVEPYSGKDSILYVDASYYFYPEITLKPATPTPVVTATPEPELTAMPAPAEPTESLENAGDTETSAPVETTPPTATPTATPVPTPTAVPTNGTLVLAVMGNDATAAYSVSAAGVTYGEGTLETGASARVPDLYMGNYIVTITMPEDVMLTGLNGYPSMQRGAAQWLVTISGGKTSLYELELSRTGAISGTLNGMTGPVNISIIGSELYSLSATDAFSQTGMTPDTYTVTVVLPEGEYEGEGWSFVESAGQLLAITKAEVTGGSVVELPAISAMVSGQVSGTVTNLKAQPMSDVRVTIFDEDGQEAASARTDGEGRWLVEGLVEGSYTVQYDAGDGSVIPADAFEIGEMSLQPELTAAQAIPASVLVQVFIDENNNGVCAKNEDYLSGALIQLVNNVDGEEIVVASDTTDSDGMVRLYAPAGKYILRCEMPEDHAFASKGSKDLITHSAMEQSISRVQEISVTLSSDAEPQIGIGAAKMAKLTGTVWQDVNCDGLWQSTEPGVEGMKVTAEGVRNGLVYETYTDEKGRFEISQIRNGTYNVTYYVPDGYVFTIKASGAQQLRSLMTTEADRTGNDQVVFEKGETVDEQNIGLMREAVIEGYCFLDGNYNGRFDEGEEVLPGVELELLRQSNSKRLKTAVSDENGYFRIGNVRGDTFKIKALLPKDMTYTINVPGDWSANQFAPREGGKREQTITGVEGVSGETLTLAIGAISYGSVAGVVYQDDNFSGDWESGEKIAQGLLVYIVNEDGETVQSAKTNKNGAFAFDDLPPGQYRLKMTAKEGFAFTKTGAGSIMVNSGDGQGESELFTLELGQDLTGMDAGMIVPAVVSGTIFADANDNGLNDAGEKGLTGTRVILMQEDGEVDDATITSSGSYVFDSVLPGRYYLRYELPENAVFSERVEGGNTVVGEGSDGAGDWFTVESGDEWTAPLCGGLELGQISGHAFADSNGSGAQDADERMLSGMTIVLTPSRSDLQVMTAVTGADGAFAFEALRPDRYTLTVTCPDGYVLSRMDAVTFGLAHGLADQTIDLNMSMGDTWTEQALGCVMPSSYSGTAWLDENDNGQHDAGEAPAAGETILMIDQTTEAVIATLVTDAQGAFTAEGLAPGTYSLIFKLADDVASVPNGTTFTVEGDRLVMRDIVIAEGTQSDGAVLGIVRETTISGLVWLDSDGQTIPVEGAEITLTDAAGEVTVITTAADGRYTFDGLAPGEYRISAVLPEGYAVIEPGDRRITDGGLISILESCAANAGESGVISLRMADHKLQMDIGSVMPGRMGDFCWLDLNGNGLQDGDEAGIPGVTITLMRNGAVVGETVSDQYGYYVFENLYPGEYTLHVTWPAEVKPTVARTDLPMIVSVLGEDGVSALIPVDSDGVNYDADLGFVLLDEDHYPAGYGEGKTQNWKFDR